MLFRVIFLLPVEGMPITQGKPRKSIPNLSIATHNSDCGISRTFLIRSLMGWLYSLFGKKKKNTHASIIDSACYRPGCGSVLVISDKLRILILACSSWMQCFRAFQTLPWRSYTNYGNSDKLQRVTWRYTQQFDCFVRHTNAPTVERHFHQMLIHDHRSSISLRSKAQILSRNLYGKGFPFYKKIYLWPVL